MTTEFRHIIRNKGVLVLALVATSYGVSEPTASRIVRHVEDCLIKSNLFNLLGRERAIVVSGAQGMDEASLDGENTFVLLDHGDIIPFKLRAEDVGLTPQPLSAIRGGSPMENAQIMRELLQGKQSAYFDTVVLNAGIGFFAYGLADTMKQGIEMAKDSIFSGRAFEKLEQVAAYSQRALQEEWTK